MNARTQFIHAIAIGVLAQAAPAAAQQSGVTVTSESGGRQAGCVDWSHVTVASPLNKNTQRVRITFTLENRCQVPVDVLLMSQTDDYGRRVGGSSSIRLAPGEIYGYEARVGNYIFFNPPTDRYLNFWVFQSNQSMSGKSRPDMSRCNPRFDPRKSAPACPPAFRL